MKKSLRVSVGLAMTLGLLLVAGSAAADAPPRVEPSSVDQALDPGQSVNIQKTVHTPAIPPSPEICFLSDTTGSMGPAIGGVQAALANVLATVVAAQPTALFCVAEYRDVGDAFEYQLNQALTANQAAVQNAINGWVAGGGGDTPEAQLQALAQLATQPATGWSPSPPATPIIVWFGDASGHDPSGTSGTTQAGAIAALTGPPNVRVIAIDVSQGLPFQDGLDNTGQATVITTATGGSLQIGVNPANIGNAILAGLSNLPVTVSWQTDCAAPISASFVPASQQVTSGQDATFTETITVAADAAAGIYTCTDTPLIDGQSIIVANNVIGESKTIRVNADIEKVSIAASGPDTGPVSEQIPFQVTQVLRNNGPGVLATVLDIKEVDCPDTNDAGDSQITQCSVLIDETIFEVSAKANVPMYRKAGCTPPKVSIGLGPFQGPPADLGLSPGDCFVVDSVPGVDKELDVKKIIDLPAGEDIEDVTTFDVHCTGRSFHTLTIQDEIQPWPPGSYEDLNLNNNAKETTYRLACLQPVILVIDEDSIDNGLTPFENDEDVAGFSTAEAVNDDVSEIGVRAQLRFFKANIGEEIDLRTGEVGDEGWFALTIDPPQWADAGGVPAYVGDPTFLPEDDPAHGVGPGLGAEDEDGDREALLDKIDGVTPLRAAGLALLAGDNHFAICAVVYDSDVSINYDDPINGSLKGANYGTVAFRVLSVTALDENVDENVSSSSLPKARISILDAEKVCKQPSLTLFTGAPVLESSSEPFDVMP